MLHHKQGQRLLRRGYLVADPEVLRLIEQNEEVRRDANALPCHTRQCCSVQMDIFHRHTMQTLPVLAACCVKDIRMVSGCEV